MKYKIKLTDEELERLNLALIAACLYEIEFLRYPGYAENGGNNPGVYGQKVNIMNYLALRHELLSFRAKAEGKVLPVVDPDDSDQMMIVNAWNREIKRLREEGSEYEKRDQCADD